MNPYRSNRDISINAIQTKIISKVELIKENSSLKIISTAFQQEPRNIKINTTMNLLIVIIYMHRIIWRG